MFVVSNSINPVNSLGNFRGRNKDFLHCRLKPRAKRARYSGFLPVRYVGCEAQNENFDDLDSSRLAYNNLKLN